MTRPPLAAYIATAAVVAMLLSAWVAYGALTERVAQMDTLTADLQASRDEADGLEAQVAAARAEAEEASRRADRALRLAQKPEAASVSPAELAALRSAVDAAVERVEAVEEEVGSDLLGGSRLDQLESGDEELRECVRALIAVLRFIDSEASNYFPYTGPRC